MSRDAARLWSSYRATLLTVPDEPTEFELKVKRLGLVDSPERWTKSNALRVWVKAHKNSRYVPDWLLREWEITGRFEGE